MAQDIALVKEVGKVTVLEILKIVGENKYGADFTGASSHVGPDSDQVVIHLVDAADDTEAVAALAAVQLPTCSDSGLNITVNVGTYLISDVTNILSDPTDIKFVKVSILLDNATGLPQVYAFEKTTLTYGDVPAGKTFCCDLKEYSVPALGTALTEIKNFIR